MGSLHGAASPANRAVHCRRCPPLGTHLHVALAAGTGHWGGGALHTKLGQEPHRLEQEQTVPSVAERDPDHSEAFLGLLQELQLP